jgi:hypothetical protein
MIAQGQSVEPAPSDKAVIYFVRPSSLAFAIDFTYFDSTRLIGKFNGPDYMRYTCNPGHHLFWARSENQSFVEANVEAGKVYFIEAIVQMGTLKAAVDLDPVPDPRDPNRMKKIIKLIERKTSKSFTREELAADQKEMWEVISKGLEEYRGDKKEGKSFPRLEKEMAYEN